MATRAYRYAILSKEGRYIAFDEASLHFWTWARALAFEWESEASAAQWLSLSDLDASNVRIVELAISDSAQPA